MEMDIEKDLLKIANIINEHHLASGDKSVGVPIKSFEQRGFGHHDVRIALAILTKSGTVENYHRCWGYNSIDKQNGTMSYDEMDIKQPKEKFENVVPAFEAYHITVVPMALKKFVSSSKVGTAKVLKNAAVELTLDKNGDLYKEPKEKFCYSMFEQAERQKILRHLIEQSKITAKYIDTEITASSLEKDTYSLRREIGKINQNAFNRLKIGRKVKMKDGRERIVEGLIDSKQDSGYRLNPKVKIVTK